MGRRDRRKSSDARTDRSQRANQLKAKALTLAAQQAWQRRLPYKTLALLTEALRREPNNQEILLQLAAAHGRQRNYDKAELYLARTLELTPRSATWHRRVAESYALIDRPERAIECYRKSLSLNSDAAATVPTLLDLAQLYERRHQLDDASTIVDEALKLQPDHQGARLQRALLDRRRGRAIEAEGVFRDLLANAAIELPIRIQAGYELAQLQDDQGLYDEAFAALTVVKRYMKSSAAGFLRETKLVIERNRQLLRDLDKATFERWHASAHGDAPYRLAVLTSHPRSGTTLVEQVLDSHDELISADEFDVYSEWIHAPIFRKFRPGTPILDVLNRVPDAVRAEARTTYWTQTEAIFDEPIGSRMLLDKNPAMTIGLPVVNWAFPEMRILFALRDPRDVILSCFLQKVPLNQISSNWLELSDAADYYACAMETWLRIRDLTSSPWIEFRYEDVVADLPAQARRILEFLGLPWDEKVLKFYEHARDKAVRSPTYEDVTKPIYQGSVGRWKNYARHIEPIVDKLKPFLDAFAYADA